MVPLLLLAGLPDTGADSTIAPGPAIVCMFITDVVLSTTDVALSTCKLLMLLLMVMSAALTVTKKLRG